jgi:hypothetical protein
VRRRRCEMERKERGGKRKSGELERKGTSSFDEL